MSPSRQFFKEIELLRRGAARTILDFQENPHQESTQQALEDLYKRLAQLAEVDLPIEDGSTEGAMSPLDLQCRLNELSSFHDIFWAYLDGPEQEKYLHRVQGHVESILTKAVQSLGMNKLDFDEAWRMLVPWAAQRCPTFLHTLIPDARAAERYVHGLPTAHLQGETAWEGLVSENSEVLLRHLINKGFREDYNSHGRTILAYARHRNHLQLLLDGGVDPLHPNVPLKLRHKALRALWVHQRERIVLPSDPLARYVADRMQQWPSKEQRQVLGVLEAQLAHKPKAYDRGQLKILVGRLRQISHCQAPTWFQTPQGPLSAASWAARTALTEETFNPLRARVSAFKGSSYGCPWRLLQDLATPDGAKGNFVFDEDAVPEALELLVQKGTPTEAAFRGAAALFERSEWVQLLPPEKIMPWMIGLLQPHARKLESAASYHMMRATVSMGKAAILHQDKASDAQKGHFGLLCLFIDQDSWSHPTVEQFEKWVELAVDHRLLPSTPLVQHALEEVRHDWPRVGAALDRVSLDDTTQAAKASQPRRGL